MKIGVTIPNHRGVEDVHGLLSLGPYAETPGFDSVWTMDPLLNVGRVRDRLEDRPYWHPLALLSYLAATTTRVALGTSVLVLPYHEPVGLASTAEDAVATASQCPQVSIALSARYLRRAARARVPHGGVQSRALYARPRNP